VKRGGWRTSACASTTRGWPGRDRQQEATPHGFSVFSLLCFQKRTKLDEKIKPPSQSTKVTSRHHALTAAPAGLLPDPAVVTAAAAALFSILRKKRPTSLHAPSLSIFGRL
jgi:hypothetical protein